MVFFFVLTGAGFAGNYFSYDIFFNLKLLFGSVFTMLVLQLLGVRAGVFSAVLISSITCQTWSHPYAMVILSLEVLIVGLQMKRTKIDIVAADAVYWVFIGMPLVYFFYHQLMQLPLTTSSLTMLKMAVNGIANALVARLVFMAIASYFRKYPYRLPELVFNVLAFFVLTVSLTLLAVHSNKEIAETDSSIRGSLGLAKERAVINTEKFLRSSFYTIHYLARQAVQQPVPRMQQQIEQALAMENDFLRIGLLDRTATVIAYSPLVDELGQANIGKNFSDRQYIAGLKETLAPRLSNIEVSRFGTPSPRAAVLAPVVSQGTFNGFVIGVLDLQVLQEILATNTRGQLVHGLRFILVDSQSRVIATNREDLKVMDTFTREAGEFRPVANGVSQWLPPGHKNISFPDRWAESLYVTESSVGDLAEWKLILELPLAPVQRALYDKYTVHFGEVFGLFLLALLLARVISRALATPLEELRSVSADVPSKLLTNELIHWPQSSVVEIQHLIDIFMEMTLALAHQFKEIRTMNEELEKRVSERTRKLQESETRFRSLFESVPNIPVQGYDHERRVIFWNKASERLYGYSEREAAGQRLEELIIPPEMSGAVIDAVTGWITAGVPIPSGELVLRRKDGSPVSVFSSHVMQRNSHGDPEMYCIDIDLSANKQAEEQLRQSTQLLRDVTANLGVGIYVFDVNGKISFMNPMAEHLWGWTMDELNERGAHALVHNRRPDGTPLPLEECRVHGVMTTGNAYASSDEVFVRRDGTVFPVSVISTPLIKEGRVVGSVTAFRDITEDKKMEAELHKAQKLESVGILAGGIAHDFNNLLTGIMGNIALGKLFLAEGKLERVPALLTVAEEASEAAKELSFRLLTFSKGGDPVLQISSIEQILRKSADLSLGAAGVAVHFDLATDLFPIEIDEGQILQVFNNIFVNAREAMPEGGAVTITGKNVVISGQEVTPLKKGLYAKISVKDTGRGIPASVLDRIFDPYFSTKGLGSIKGTGLGLSICMSIVKKHEGHISVESQEGAGATFHVWLPATPERLEGRLPELERVPSASGRKILFMDDDERIRSLVQNMTEFLGYAVTFALTGEEAIEIFSRARACGESFDLVILDLTIQGGMGGELAVKRLLELDPTVKAVISSGYADSPVLQHYQDHGFVAAIAKPYRIEQLKELLDKLFP